MGRCGNAHAYQDTLSSAFHTKIVLALFSSSETLRFLNVRHMHNLCSQTKGQDVVRHIFDSALGGWQLTIVAEGVHENVG